MVLSIIFPEDKHKVLLHLLIFYEYQQFFSTPYLFIDTAARLHMLVRSRDYPMYVHVYSCYDFICKEIFVMRLSKNQYKSTVYTHNSYNY